VWQWLTISESPDFSLLFCLSQVESKNAKALQKSQTFFEDHPNLYSLHPEIIISGLAAAILDFKNAGSFPVVYNREFESPYFSEQNDIITQSLSRTAH